MRRTVGPSDPEWPPLLSELGPAAPERLFVTGRLLDGLRPAVAVVGTRRPTAAGLEAAERISSGLAEAGVLVVSGLAVGIDAVAHVAALAAGGTTAAVLGCGIDVDYPRRNLELKRRIAVDGTIMSEFSDGTPPRRTQFPLRNRIIAGISAGVVVVEGGMRSGALITARLALDSNRNVYAVPGSIRNPMAAAPNELIRTSQALLVTGVNDVLEDLVPSLCRPGSNVGLETPRLETPRLEGPEEVVLRALDDVAVSPGLLEHATGLSAGALARALAELELRGLADRLRGGYCVTAAGARALDR
jgi:DNA processing protein